MRFPLRIFLPFLLIAFAIAPSQGDLEQEQHEGSHPASSDLDQSTSSSNASDYADLSLDQLKTELDRKRDAEKKEKEAYDAADKAVRGTKDLLAVTIRNLTEKTNEWLRLQGIVDKIDEADRIVTEKRKEVKRIADSIASLQGKLKPFETTRDDALRDIYVLNNIDTLLTDAKAKQTEQQNEINKQELNATTLKGLAKTQEGLVKTPRENYELYLALYGDEKCGTPKALPSCAQTEIVRDDYWSKFFPLNETWTRLIANYKEAESTVKKLTDNKTDGIDKTVKDLTMKKINKDGSLKHFQGELEKAEKDAKPFNETLLREQELQHIAEKALEDAIEAKNVADGKMSASEVNDARVAARVAKKAQLEANATKTALDEQLKTQQDTLHDKEKEWNDTKLAIAALQTQYDKNNAPSTGGLSSYLWYLLGGVLICGLVALVVSVGSWKWWENNKRKIKLKKLRKEKKAAASSQSSAKSSSIVTAAPGKSEQALSVPEKMVDCGEETITNRLADEGAKEIKPPAQTLKVKDPKDLPSNIKKNPEQYPVIEGRHKPKMDINVEANNSVCVDLDAPKGTMHVDSTGSEEFHVDVDSLKVRMLNAPLLWSEGDPIDLSKYDEMEGDFFIVYDISGMYPWNKDEPHWRDTLARFNGKQQPSANANAPEAKPSTSPLRGPSGRSPLNTDVESQVESGPKERDVSPLDVVLAHGEGHEQFEGLESTDYYEETYGKYQMLRKLKKMYEEETSNFAGLFRASEEDDEDDEEDPPEHYRRPRDGVKPDQTEHHQQSGDNNKAIDKTKQKQQSSSGDNADVVDETEQYQQNGDDDNSIDKTEQQQQSSISGDVAVDEAIDDTQDSSTNNIESIMPVPSGPRAGAGASNRSLIEKADSSQKTQKTQMTGVTGPEPAPANAPQSDPSDVTARDNTATGKAKEEDEKPVARIPDAPQPSNDKSLRMVTAIGKVQTSVRKSPSGVSRASIKEKPKRVEERRRESRGSNKKLTTKSRGKRSGTTKNTKRRRKSTHTKKSHTRRKRRSHDRDDSEDSNKSPPSDSNSGKTSILGAVSGVLSRYRSDTWEGKKKRMLNFLKTLLTDTIEDFTEHHNDLADVFIFAIEMLAREPKVLYPEAPAQIDGDTHGNLPFLKRLLCSGRRGYKWIFLGDYVDRGANSLQVLAIVVTLKILYPNLAIVLRGNHEDPKTNKGYGFYDEVNGNEKEDIESRFETKEQAREIWELIEHLFARMPVAAVLGNVVYCSHGGGIPKNLTNLKELNELIPEAVYDTTRDKWVSTILWSDFGRGLLESIRNFTRGGAGWMQCEADIKELMKKHGIKLIIRGHQCPNCGHEFFLGWDVLTIFGSTNYNSTKDNFATVVLVHVTPKGKIVLALSIIEFFDKKTYDPERFGPDAKAKLCKCKHETIHYTAKKDSAGELGTGSLTQPVVTARSASSASLAPSMTAIDDEFVGDDPTDHCRSGLPSAAS